jgi:hypothetical protein
MLFGSAHVAAAASGINPPLILRAILAEMPFLVANKTSGEGKHAFNFRLVAVVYRMTIFPAIKAFLRRDFFTLNCLSALLDCVATPSTPEADHLPHRVVALVSRVRKQQDLAYPLVEFSLFSLPPMVFALFFP